MEFTPTLLEVLVLLVTSIISGLVGFSLQYLLPENLRSRIIYGMRSWKKRRKDNIVTTSLTAKYTLDDPVPLDTISDEIRGDLSNIVNEDTRIVDKGSNEPGDRHFIDIETSRANLRVNVIVNATPGKGVPGSPEFDPMNERVAESITVESEIRTKYSNLRWGLELGAQYIDDFQSAVSFKIDKSSTYNVACELDSPTVIEDFLAKLSVDSVKAENNSVEVQFEDEKVLVRNVSVGDRPDIFDKLQDLVIYYG
ncbi:hypothetical protein [Halobiforma nitratireducens]|uniref:hypothetical protein n=1 Tax=Halobiforma nitratireducens TaxID=130048 RepID=UPI00126857AA|nr:hypothetical protein [Halobiforma nitratireducens]